MLLLTRGTTFFFAASVAWPFKLPDGAGVSFSLKGCAADVDVAAGGLWEEVESPCRGAGCVAEMGVAFARREDVVKRRCEDDALEAARRQLRQIMVGGVVGFQLQLDFVTASDGTLKSLAWVEVRSRFVSPNRAALMRRRLWWAPRDSHKPKWLCDCLQIDCI